MKIEDIAIICYEANRVLCELQGDNSQKPWTEAADWQKESAKRQVRFAIDNPNATPEAQHESWMAEKYQQEWVYGEKKDPVLKTHPCLVPYNELPKEQQAKDHLFRAIVKALAPFLDNRQE